MADLQISLSPKSLFSKVVGNGVTWHSQVKKFKNIFKPNKFFILLKRFYMFKLFTSKTNLWNKKFKFFYIWWSHKVQSSKKIHKVFFSNQIFYAKKFLCLNFLLQESIHETKNSNFLCFMESSGVVKLKNLKNFLYFFCLRSKNSNFLFHGVTWCNQVKILKVALYIYLKYLFSLPLFFAF